MAKSSPFKPRPVYRGGKLIGVQDPIKKETRLPTPADKLTYPGTTRSGGGGGGSSSYREKTKTPALANVPEGNVEEELEKKSPKTIVGRGSSTSVTQVKSAEEKKIKVSPTGAVTIGEGTKARTYVGGATLPGMGVTAQQYSTGLKREAVSRGEISQRDFGKVGFVGTFYPNGGPVQVPDYEQGISERAMVEVNSPQQQAERFRKFKFNREDFLSRSKSGSVSVPGTISRTLFTTGAFVSAQARLDKLFPNQPTFKMSRLERVGSDIATFTFFSPALSTTTQIQKAVQPVKVKIKGFSQKQPSGLTQTQVEFQTSTGQKGVARAVTRDIGKTSTGAVRTETAVTGFRTGKVLKIPGGIKTQSSKPFIGMQRTISTPKTFTVTSSPVKGITTTRDIVGSQQINVGIIGKPSAGVSFPSAKPIAKITSAKPFIGSGFSQTTKGVTQFTGVTKVAYSPDVISRGIIKNLPRAGSFSTGGITTSIGRTGGGLVQTSSQATQSLSSVIASSVTKPAITRFPQTIASFPVVRAIPKAISSTTLTTPQQLEPPTLKQPSAIIPRITETPAPRMKTLSIQKQSPVPKGKEITSPIDIPKTRGAPKIGTRTVTPPKIPQKQIGKFSPTPIPTTPPSVPFIPPFALPFGADRTGGFKRIPASRKYSYFPSFKALAFGIRGRGKRPLGTKRFTGLETRPIFKNFKYSTNKRASRVRLPIIYSPFVRRKKKKKR
jgi:hypothetical protein